MRITTPLLFLALLVSPAVAQERGAKLRPVSVGGKWGYADESGNVVIEPKYEEVGPFSDGLAAVAVGADPHAKSVIRGSTEHGFYTFYIIRADLRWGYVDETGRLTIPLRFNYGFPFSDGLAAVKVGRKVGYIDRSGRMAIRPRFFDGTGFVGGRAWVSIGEFEFQPTSTPKPDFFGVKFRGQYGYINPRGRFTKTTFGDWYNARWPRPHNGRRRARN